jgi:hypothetical protein
MGSVIDTEAVYPADVVPQPHKRTPWSQDARD